MPMNEPRTEEEWQKMLTPEEYHVLREGGTEAPFVGKYVENHADGTYRCRACHAILFSALAKFDSGSGWPSFTDPMVEKNVGTRLDESHGMVRTEVFCTNCGSHLGHLFDDGPPEAGGLRYCINSIALDFEKRDRNPS
jgi:peptide-methionine (R)-S-oxide reductase